MASKHKTVKQRVSHRLKITRGHLKKVITMVEHDDYCIDIIHQSQAVQKALKEIDDLILENHLKTCASEAIRMGNEEKAIEEIMHVFKRRKLWI